VDEAKVGGEEKMGRNVKTKKSNTKTKNFTALKIIVFTRCATG